MTKNKSRKLFAATASSALVASAVVPAAVLADSKFTDVPSGIWYEDAVNYFADKGVIQGPGDGTFNPNGLIDRAQAAEIMSKALDLPAGKPTDFTDVSDKTKWYYKAVNAVVDAGLFQGTGDNKFSPEMNLSRAQAAKVIVDAYELEGEADLSEFPDVNSIPGWAKEEKNYLAIAVKNGVINGQEKDGKTYLAPNANITRAEYATMLKRAIDGPEVVAPAVSGVKVLDAKTLEITGSNLGNLESENISIEENEVDSITPSKDGKSATIKLKHSLTHDKEYTATFKLNDGDKSFKIKYSVDEVKSVELDVRSYDDDTANQTLTFKVNGESTTADTEWLRQAGYTVNFVAVDEDNNAASIFATGNNTSTTGLLANEIPVGKYTVEIQIQKDGKVVVSDKKVITVADLESTTTAINSVQLTNGVGFVHNSNTLVVGETADITGIVGDAAGKKGVSIPVALAEITSSNPAIISVDGNELTANGTGNVTITVKIGDVTKTLDLKVANATRAVSKITPTEGTVKVVQGITRTIDVNAVDQYGDPIEVATNDVVEDRPKNAANADLIDPVDIVTGIDGTTGGLAITGSTTTTGNGTLIFKDTDGKNIGQVGIQVTDVDNAVSTKVEYTVASDKTTNSIEVGDTNQYQVSKFNKNGFYNGAETLNLGPATAGELTVESADPTVATVSLVAGNEAFEVNPVKAGKTDIVIKDNEGFVKHKFTVTVSESPIVITKVNFKSISTVDYVGKTIDIEDVLDIRPDTGNDDIVYGVEHNANTIAKVRVDDTDADQPVLYIDTDNNGQNGAGDIILGAVEAEVLSGSKGVTAGPIDIAPGSYTTASGDKGTILFRVIAPENGQFDKINTVATSVINVDVK